MILSALVHFNRCFIDLKKSHFWLVMKQKMIQSDIRQLESSIFDFIQIAFWPSPEAHNKM